MDKQAQSAQLQINLDGQARTTHLQSLLDGVNDSIRHLEANQAKILTHHESKERGHALAQVKGAMRRMDKARRRLERQIAVAQK